MHRHGPQSFVVVDQERVDRRPDRAHARTHGGRELSSCNRPPSLPPLLPLPSFLNGAPFSTSVFLSAFLPSPPLLPPVTRAFLRPRPRRFTLRSTRNNPPENQPPERTKSLVSRRVDITGDDNMHTHTHTPCFVFSLFLSPARYFSRLRRYLCPPSSLLKNTRELR